MGIVVVDTCLTPSPMADKVKEMVARQTQLRSDRILISATHCHSAPSLGDNLVVPDERYVAFLQEKLVQLIVEAERNLEPAAVGWASINAEKYTALRRWIRRTDRIDNDVFGNRTVGANMHAATIGIT